MWFFSRSKFSPEKNNDQSVVPISHQRLKADQARPATYYEGAAPTNHTPMVAAEGPKRGISETTLTVGTTGLASMNIPKKNSVRTDLLFIMPKYLANLNYAISNHKQPAPNGHNSVTPP